MGDVGLVGRVLINLFGYWSQSSGSIFTIDAP